MSDEITPDELMALEAKTIDELVDMGVLATDELPSMFHTLEFSKTDGTITGEWVVVDTAAAGKALTAHILKVESLASQTSKLQQQVDGTLTGDKLAEFEAFKAWKDECIALYKDGVFEWPEFGG